MTTVLLKHNNWSFKLYRYCTSLKKGSKTSVNARPLSRSMTSAVLALREWRPRFQLRWSTVAPLFNKVAALFKCFVMVKKPQNNLLLCNSFPISCLNTVITFLISILILIHLIKKYAALSTYLFLTYLLITWVRFTRNYSHLLLNSAAFSRIITSFSRALCYACMVFSLFYFF